MQMGFGLPVSGSWATPERQVAVARRAEELGYASVWTFQRLLYPADPSTGRWFEGYRSVLDPLVSLAFVAGQTSRVRLGVSVLNAPFVSPAILAKQTSTLDLLSGGRLDVGLGLGWAKEEYAVTGASYEGRGRRLEESIEVLRALWSGDVVKHAGEFYTVPDVAMNPTPVQRPGPPILIGGSAEVALRRAGRLADGWLSGSNAGPAVVREAIRVVRTAAQEADRDPDGLRFIARVAARVRTPSRPDRRPYTGTIDEIRQDLAELAGAGCTEAFVDLNFDPHIGSPDADPDESMASAEAALTAFAPPPGGGRE